MQKKQYLCTLQRFLIQKTLQMYSITNNKSYIKNLNHYGKF